MDQDRWDKLEILLEQALALPVPKRSRFLKQACGNDTGLQYEIESLLNNSKTAFGFFQDLSEQFVLPSLINLHSSLDISEAADSPPFTDKKLLHFRILSQIGSGGMGVVYKARDLRLDRFVAIKLLPFHLSNDKTAKSRFISEAKAVSGLDHPNICTLYDICETDPNLLFMVMAWYRGETLEQKIKKTPLNLQQALHYVIQTAEGLASAHAAGIIHMDVKPANIMITHEDAVKILDFGIAKSVKREPVSQSLLAGSLPYMSPEQIRGDEPDHRTDIWSLGIVLYQIFAGKRPFQAKSNTNLLQTILNEPPQPDEDLYSQMPATLQKVMVKCLEKNPEQRYCDMTELIIGLKDVLRTIEPGVQSVRNTSGEKFRITGIKNRRFPKIPTYLTSFIGREKELSDIKTYLSDTRLLTLTGFGGTGKSRLVLSLIPALNSMFEDGIYFIDLSSVRNHDQVIPAIAKHFDLKESIGETLLFALKKFLGDKKLLLILDNFEQVIRAAPKISELLQHAPACKFLITSREPLRIHGEQEYPIPPLSTPGKSSDDTVETLLKYESIDLFVQRAQQVQPDFRITPANQETITEICRKLDGLPLALELAAARISIMTPSSLLERLDDRFKLLVSGARDQPERHKTLHETIAWSYNLLTTDEKKVLEAASVFSGGFTLEYIESMMTELNHDRVDTLEILSSLSNKNLIYKNGEIYDKSRFSMLESIQEFVHKQIKEKNRRLPLHKTHRAVFAKECTKILRDLTDQHHEFRMDRMEYIDLEYDNLVKTLEYEVTSVAESHQRLIVCNVLWRYWLHKCRFTEGRSRIRTTIENTKNVSSDDQIADLLLGAGTLAHNNGDYVDAKERFTQCLELCRKSDDEEGVAKALTNLGWVGFRQGNYQDAKLYCEKALQIQQKRNDLAGISFILNNLGWIAHHQGEFLLAKKYHEECLDLRRPIGDKRNVAFSLTNLAWSIHKTGDNSRAMTLLNEALSLFDEVRERQLYTFALCIKSEIMINEGQPGKAHILLKDKVLPEFQEINDTYGVALSMNHIGSALFQKKNFEEASQFYRKSYLIRQKLGDRWGMAQALCNEGRATINSEKKTLKTDSLKKSLDIRHELEDKLGLAESLEVISEYFYTTKSYDKAFQLSEIASVLRLLIHSPRPKEKGTVYAAVLIKENNFDPGYETLQKLKMISEQKDVSDLIHISDEITSSLPR